ncbi:L,D-transpeptidase [Jatrophihabitans fulvus]
MRKQQIGGTVKRERARRHLAVTAVLGVVAVALAACTSSGGPSDTKADRSEVAGSQSAAPTSTEPSSEASAPAAVITATPASAATAISPTDKVSVAIANGTLTSVSLVNPFGKSVRGEMSDDRTSWRLAEPLGYDRTYKLVATGRNGDGVAVTKRTTVTTVTPDNYTMPSITDVYGNAVGNKAVYGVGMIFRVHFDEPVNRAAAQKTLTVKASTPSGSAVSGGWYWSDDQNVWWRPKSYYTEGTKVSVRADVYGKKVGEGLYGQDDRAVAFTIGQKRVSIANGRTHQVKVFFDDKLVRTMPTSMGKGGYEPGNDSINYWTMRGDYTVIGHENPAIMSSASFGVEKGSPNYYDKISVPWSTKVSTDGIYLHEKNDTEWAQGSENVSHGCLNLVTKHAKWFFQNTRVGDVVRMVETGGPLITFNQGGQWSMPWSEWQKGSAL